jgi:RNAse (barnase) inhibitor barstar
VWERRSLPALNKGQSEKSDWPFPFVCKLLRDRIPCDMTIYEIDGERFSTLEEFYKEVDRILRPSDWGHNLDAFNDILRGGFGTPEGGFTICWKNHDVSRVRLGYPETVRQLKLRLKRCHPSNRETVARYLTDAKQGRDQTVFDWLTDIIRKHGPGGKEQEDKVELVLD